MIYYFVYETTNLVNGKKYRGVHKTSKMEDGYLGSGIILEKAIKKYGKENFERIILEFCESYDKVLEREKEWVNEEWVKSDLNYNLKTGGQSAGILSDESKKKISDSLKRGYSNGEIGKRFGEAFYIPTDEQKEVISIFQKERYKNDENHTFKIYNTPWNKDKKDSQVPWNKGKKGLQEAWNKGLKQPITEERREKLKGIEPWNKGKKGLQEAWNKGIETIKTECPNCGKLVDKANGKRWHFDNCKLKINET